MEQLKLELASVDSPIPSHAFILFYSLYFITKGSVESLAKVKINNLLLSALAECQSMYCRRLLRWSGVIFSS